MTVMRKIVAALSYPFCFVGAAMLRTKRGCAITLFSLAAADTSASRNLGDNAILLAMLQVLGHVPRDIEIGLRDCTGTYARYGNEFNRPVGVRTFIGCLSAIRKTEVFVVGGGGLFQDYGRFREIPVVHFLVILLFRIAGCRIMWYSVGVGPLETWLGRLFTRLAANISHVVTVRDTGSRDLLVRIGVNKSDVHVTADPVVALSVPASDVTLASRRPQLGISVFPFYSVVEGNDVKSDELFTIYTHFVDHVLAAGYSVRLLPFHNAQDLPFCQRIATEVRGFSRSDYVDIEVVGCGLSCEEIMARYRELDYVIGMRFHSIVFGILASFPCGAVVYHPKVRSIMLDAHLDAYSVELGDLSVAGLEHILVCLNNDKPLVKERMALWLRSERTKLMTNAVLLERLLDERYSSPFRPS